MQETFPQPCRRSQSDMLRIAKYDCSVTVTISPESISRFTRRVIEDLNKFLERHLMGLFLVYVKSNICQKRCMCVCVGGWGYLEMQRLAQCPVNFNWASEGTNQELRVDISFKSASLLSGEGILSALEKKAIVCCFHDYPLQKPISCLKVLKESSRKINNIDYQPTALFFFFFF